MRQSLDPCVKLLLVSRMLNLASAFNPSGPSFAYEDAAKNRIDNHAAVMRINGESIDSIKLKLMKLRAERMSLQAELAALSLKKLECQSQQLRGPSGAKGHSGRSELAGSSSQALGAPWPKQGEFHRFIAEDNTTRSNLKTVSYLFKARDRFFGARKPGVYNRTFQVRFMLPGNLDEPKTIELLQVSKGNPLFGVVVLRPIALLLLDVVAIYSEETLATHLVVQDKPDDYDVDREPNFDDDDPDVFDRALDNFALNVASLVQKLNYELQVNIVNALERGVIPVLEDWEDKFDHMFLAGGIQKGDIIRGISIPQIEDIGQGIRKSLCVDILDDMHVDEGMVFLDGKDVDRFENVGFAHVLANCTSDIVVLIERPKDTPPVSGG